MNRRGTTKVVAMAAVSSVLAGGLLLRTAPTDAQPGKPLVRGNAYGEWRHWGADQWSSRYSPLD